MDQTTTNPLSRIAHRRALRAKRKFVIDPIFPAGDIHVIGGASGAGKTTWLLQTLYEWDTGQMSVEGWTPHPCKWVYVSLDRATHATDSTLVRIGLEDWDAPIYSIEEVNPHTNEANIENIVNMFPQVDLFVIEGLQGLIPDTRPGERQNKAELRWMIHLRKEVLSQGRTIIAVTHDPKSSGSQNYVDANRERSNGFLGSQALIGSMSTMVLVEPFCPRKKGKPVNEKTDDRLVTVMGRDFPNQYHVYQRDNKGRFVLYDGEEDTGAPIIAAALDLALNAKIPSGFYTREEIVTQLQQFSKCSARSAAAFVKSILTASNDDRIVKAEHGRYKVNQLVDGRPGRDR